MNEFDELFFDTLIAFYVTLHYINERKYLEAVHLSKHTLSQIENCLDFANRSSSSSLGPYEAHVKKQAERLETEFAVNARKLQIKAHAKHLATEVENEAAEKRQAAQEAMGDPSTTQQAKKKATSSVQYDSLYDLLYDQNGKSKAQNLNQKVVIQGPTLEILESKGNAVSI